jgi:hypothetical protein
VEADYWVLYATKAQAGIDHSRARIDRDEALFPEAPVPMKPMFLSDVENYSAPEPYATVFGQMRSAGIPIPQIMHLLAFKPEQTQYLSLFTQGVMRGPSPLPTWQRELIAAFTSKLNQCLF